MIVDLALPQPAAKLSSQSQIARVSTENWAQRELYCIACTSQNLEATTANTQGVDFVCSRCSAMYQLKSSAKIFGKSLTGASYKATLEAFQSDNGPHLLLLHYAYQMVVSLLLIPSFAIPLTAIKQRQPLGPNARRAGWVGCTIQLEEIPTTARISLISNGIATNPTHARKSFELLKPLTTLNVKLRGWALDVFTQAQKLSTRRFTLQDLYRFESEFAKKHPENRNVRAKVRQQLQLLRDLGLLEFIGDGVYQLN